MTRVLEQWGDFLRRVRRVLAQGRRLGIAAVVSAAVVASAASATPHPNAGTWHAPELLSGTVGLSEPRLAAGPDGLFAVANVPGPVHAPAAVFRAVDGGTRFVRVAGMPAGQDQPTIDLDIVQTRSGRLVANELDARAYTVRTSYSDDRGASWHASTGLGADMDRQWMATGPGRRVYLVWHNLYTGNAIQEMVVQTSTDDGASFGPPVAVLPPTSPALADLACGDSTGPSGIAVDQRNGRLYVSFGTRTSPAGGGCGQWAQANPRFNVVPSTRLWVASSPDGSSGSWSTKLVEDTSASDTPVGVQYAPIAVGDDGVVYLAYSHGIGTEDYRSDIRYRWSKDQGADWSAAVVLPHSQPALFADVVAGAAGRIALSYLQAQPVSSGDDRWFPTATVVVGATGTQPAFTTTTLSTFPSHVGTPAAMAASCATGPGSGLKQGDFCDRYLDNFGLTSDSTGRVSVIWPALFAYLGHRPNGVYVTTQTTGPYLR